MGGETLEIYSPLCFLIISPTLFRAVMSGASFEMKLFGPD
jgi:hypothetical protein